MTSAVANPADVIAYLYFCIGWNGGYVPIYLDGARQARTHINGHSGDRLANLARRWDLQDNAQVEIGLPEPTAGAGTGSSTVLWVWLESRDSARRAARRFRPLPALVLRMGSSCRRLCLWPLRESVPFASLESANKRIAYALHAPQKYALPEKLRIPLPGTFLRVGRKTPAPVLTTRMELETFERAQVVGRLRDPPDPYMRRLREGRIPGRR